jgi:transcriptional regulator CtsR
LIFAAIKRIRKDITKSLNADAVVFFNDRGLLTPWEYNFLQDTLARRVLSPAQSAARENINRKVLSAVSRRGFQGPD